MVTLISFVLQSSSPLIQRNKVVLTFCASRMAEGSYKAMLLGYDDSSSEEEEELLDDQEELEQVGLWLHAESSGNRRGRGSVPGRIVIDREHAAGYARIMADYFVPNPVYTDLQFRRR